MSGARTALRLALAGAGHVGQALLQILIERTTAIEAAYGLRFEIWLAWDGGGGVAGARPLDPLALLEWKRAGRRLGSMPGASAEFDAVASLGELARRARAEAAAPVLVDLAPTDLARAEPALSYERAALEAGAHLVTANKGPLALFGPELTALAAALGAEIWSSGATAAALPTASFARRELAGSRLFSFEGILNGTTNHILTRMHRAGTSFDAALAEAQAQGIAERDPHLDVSGLDAAAKLTIIAGAAFGLPVRLGDVAVEGIEALSTSDVARAQAEGRTIKLVARARHSGGDLRLTVAPEALPDAHPLANVHGGEKAIVFETDLLGRLAVVGGGSGPAAAAASVLRDLIGLGLSLSRR